MPFLTGVGQAINAAVDAGAAAATATAGGRLRISPDQLDGAIAVFQDALNALEGEVRWASQEIYAQPPANDQVSNDAANAFNRVGYVNENSAVVAWEGAVQQLRSIVEQLQAAKQTIMQTDTGNVANFQAP